MHPPGEKAFKCQFNSTRNSKEINIDNSARVPHYRNSREAAGHFFPLPIKIENFLVLSPVEDLAEDYNK
ncbi:hypothetical protein NPIL_300231 [Nephila pilipes]|uniref:Uncharacterized protein n=1 Tax=Nephila pilipes TaxID=299642 RepID=A0A8X6TDW0_NEPPI|nr:hypothetical protein NPIL_300231 [Nephila pilipes]